MNSFVNDEKINPQTKTKRNRVLNEDVPLFPEKWRKQKSYTIHKIDKEKYENLHINHKQKAKNKIENEHPLNKVQRKVLDQAAQADIYEAAENNKKAYKKLLDLGKGLSKRINAGAVYTAESIKEKGYEDCLENSLQENGPAIIIAPLKPEDSAQAKVDHLYNGDWRKLGDVLRATIAVESISMIPEAIDKLKKEMDRQNWDVVGNLSNRFDDPTNMGYRDAKINVRSPAGFVAEIQINTKEMLYTKEIGEGHKLYKEKRSIERQAELDNRTITASERDRIEELKDKSKRIYNEALEE